MLGIYDRSTVVDGGFPLFSEVLKNYNYATHGIVSHSLLSPRLGFGRGFDYYEELSPLLTGISSPIINQKATSYIQCKHDNPFFLFLHYFDPHYNYVLHKQYTYHPSYKGWIKSGHPIIELWPILDTLSQEDIRYLLSLYDSEIAFTDFHIGQLLSELRNQDLYDNSIIIITSDHGEEFMERGWLGHTLTLHQELIQVPLIIKFPRGKARIIDSTVSLMDIMPTLCQYLNFEIPDGIDGKALDLRRDSATTNGPIYSETYNPQAQRPNATPVAFVSIILDNWKLIYDGINKSRQVYNLSTDPHEQNNLSGSHSEQNRTLNALLSKWVSYVKTKQNAGPPQDENDLFTPEQRKQLESLGYL